MKKIIALLIMLTTILIACTSGGKVDPTPPVPGNWTLYGNQPFATPGENPNPVEVISLALDNNGTPYVAYSQGYYITGISANFKKWDGTSWVEIAPDSLNFCAGNVSYISLDLDRRDPKNPIPYIAYTSVNETGVPLKGLLTRWDGSKWGYMAPNKQSFSTGTLGEDLPAVYVSLTLDNNATPYIAYAQPQGVVRSKGIGILRKWNGTNWTAVADGKDSFYGTKQVAYVSMTLDANNNPYIAFADSDGRDGYGPGILIRWDGANWTPMAEGKESFSDSQNVRHISLALNNNTPYVAYAIGDKFGSGAAYVKKWDRSDWVKLGGPFSEGHNVGTIFLSFDNNGILYIIYKETDTGIGIARKWNESTQSWSQPLGTSFGDIYTGSALCAAVWNDIPYIAYSEQNEGEGRLVYFSTK